MDWLIWSGAGVSILGIAGIAWCIMLVARARGASLPDAELRVRLQRVVALNFGALFLSAIGLMMVVIGILFA